MTFIEIQAILRDLCKKEGGAKPWAIKNKVSHSHVSAILRGDAKPEEVILKAIGEYYGMDVTKIVEYRFD